jgi:hypothetical protein
MSAQWAIYYLALIAFIIGAVVYLYSYPSLCMAHNPQNISSIWHTLDNKSIDINNNNYSSTIGSLSSDEISYNMLRFCHFGKPTDEYNAELIVALAISLSALALMIYELTRQIR